MILSLKNVGKDFFSKGRESFSVSNIDVAISQGQILGLIGKSGAGKSTILRCINLLERPDRGEINFLGQDLLSLSAAELRKVRKKIGFISQGYHLLTRHSVFDNVALPLTCDHAASDKVGSMVEKALHCVGLSGYVNAYPSQLSGGQRQRVAIARSLVMNPQLLLCDEITSALDPQTTEEILDLLLKINSELNISMVFVTHDMQVIKKIASSVCVLDHGKIIESGHVFKILTKPEHPITQSLVSSLWMNELPIFIKQQLHQTSTAGIDDIVLKLQFTGQCSTKPIISSLIESFHIPINILAGNLDHLGVETFGHLYISFRHHAQETSKILHFLDSHNVLVETVGYLQWA